MNDKQRVHIFEMLAEIIEDRKNNPRENSYTNQLLDAGRNRIAQKVGEEATELIVAVLGNEGREAIVAETSDLLYHVLVLLGEQDISLNEIYDELASRHRIKTTGRNDAHD